jgi:hypothetical protein
VALPVAVRLRPVVTAVNGTLMAWPVRMTLLQACAVAPTLTVGCGTSSATNRVVATPSQTARRSPGPVTGEACCASASDQDRINRAGLEQIKCLYVGVEIATPVVS